MIRIQQTDDGWVIEVTGKSEANGKETVSLDKAVAKAVGEERARCVAWLLDSNVNWEAYKGICDGKEAPK